MRSLTAGETEVGKIYLTTHTAEANPPGPYRVRVDEKLTDGSVKLFLVDKGTSPVVPADYPLVEPESEVPAHEPVRVEDPAKGQDAEESAIGDEIEEEEIEEDVEEETEEETEEEETEPVEPVHDQEEYPDGKPGGSGGSVVGDIGSLVGSPPKDPAAADGNGKEGAPDPGKKKEEKKKPAKKVEKKAVKKKVAKKEPVKSGKEAPKIGPTTFAKDMLLEGGKTMAQMIEGVRKVFPDKTDKQIRNIVSTVISRLNKNELDKKGEMIKRQDNGVFAITKKEG